MEVNTERYAEASKWVNDYSDMLYTFAMQRTGSEELAKDLVQETFLAAWKSYEGFKREASVKNWLFVILKNKLTDYYRTAANRFTNELKSATGTESPFFDGEDHWAKGYYPKEWDINVNHTIETKEFYSILNKCRGKLKEIQRAVFFMKYMDGMKSEEICKTLHLSNSNYWVVMHRAKVQLRACLEVNWFTP